jgi:hypothetical protein
MNVNVSRRERARTVINCKISLMIVRRSSPLTPTRALTSTASYLSGPRHVLEAENTRRVKPGYGAAMQILQVKIGGDALASHKQLTAAASPLRLHRPKEGDRSICP